MDIKIDIGAMRHRVSLMQPSQMADSIGDIGEPVVFAERWAEVRTLSGQEFYRSQQFTSEANRLVVMRYLAGVVPSMTVQFGTRSFEILWVENVEERNVKLNLYVKEVL